MSKWRIHFIFKGEKPRLSLLILHVPPSNLSAPGDQKSWCREAGRRGKQWWISHVKGQHRASTPRLQLAYACYKFMSLLPPDNGIEMKLICRLFCKLRRQDVWNLTLGGWEPVVEEELLRWSWNRMVQLHAALSEMQSCQLFCMYTCIAVRSSVCLSLSTSLYCFNLHTQQMFDGWWSGALG